MRTLTDTKAFQRGKLCFGRSKCNKIHLTSPTRQNHPPFLASRRLTDSSKLRHKADNIGYRKYRKHERLSCLIEEDESDGLSFPANVTGHLPTFRSDILRDIFQLSTCAITNTIHIKKVCFMAQSGRIGKIHAAVPYNYTTTDRPIVQRSLVIVSHRLPNPSQPSMHDSSSIWLLVRRSM